MHDDYSSLTHYPHIVLRVAGKKLYSINSFSERCASFRRVSFLRDFARRNSPVEDGIIRRRFAIRATNGRMSSGGREEKEGIKQSYMLNKWIPLSLCRVVG